MYTLTRHERWNLDQTKIIKKRYFSWIYCLIVSCEFIYSSGYTKPIIVFEFRMGNANLSFQDWRLKFEVKKVRYIIFMCSNKSPNIDVAR